MVGIDYLVSLIEDFYSLCAFTIDVYWSNNTYIIHYISCTTMTLLVEPAVRPVNAQ